MSTFWTTMPIAFWTTHSQKSYQFPELYSLTAKSGERNISKWYRKLQYYRIAQIP